MRDGIQSLDKRWCFVCGESVVAGVIHAYLSILTHRGACDQIVMAERRIYDRSARGRWRPRGEVLQRLRARRASGHSAEVPA